MINFQKEKPREVLALKDVISIEEAVAGESFQFILCTQNKKQKVKWHLRAETEVS